MGFFKDLSTLKHQSREMQKNTDVKATMANGMAQMQAANAMMQQQTTASMMAISGQDATAKIAGPARRRPATIRPGRPTPANSR
jgi:roadblock/LC7 domain-containing protein